MNSGKRASGTRGRHRGIRRWLVALLAAAVSVTVTSASAAIAVETAGTLRTSTPNVSVGGQAKFTGGLPTRVRRVIKLQRKTPSGWLVVTNGATTRLGKFALTTAVPSRPGRYEFRALAPRKVTSARTYMAVKTPSVVVSVSSPLGSRENPYPINTYFASGSWGFTVGATDTDAWPEIAAENQFNEPPLPGWSYVMVPVTVTYLGAGSESPWLWTYVKFVGSNGVVYDDYSNQSCGVVPNDSDDVPELYPGASATGNACAVVPTDAIAGGLWRLSSDNGPERFSKLS